MATPPQKPGGPYTPSPGLFFDSHGRKLPPAGLDEAGQKEFIKNRDEAERAKTLGLIGANLKKETEKWKKSNGGKLPTEEQKVLYPDTMGVKIALAAAAKKDPDVRITMLNKNLDFSLPEDRGRIMLMAWENDVSENGKITTERYVAGKIVINPPGATLSITKEGAITLSKPEPFLPMLQTAPKINFPVVTEANPTGKPATFRGGVVEVEGHKNGMKLDVNAQFAEQDGLKLRPKGKVDINLGIDAGHVTVEPKDNAVTTIRIPVEKGQFNTEDIPLGYTKYAFGTKAVVMPDNNNPTVKLELYDPKNPGLKTVIDLKGGKDQERANSKLIEEKMKEILEGKLKVPATKEAVITLGADETLQGPGPFPQGRSPQSGRKMV